MTLCVINHNGAAYVGDCLESATTQGPAFAQILMVDDASHDDSVEIVSRRFPDVRIVRLPDNMGPAAARNRALREAQTDLVLLVDNDVRIAADCVARLVEALQSHPTAAVAMPVVVRADRPDLVQYDGADCHFLGLQLIRNADRPLELCQGDIRRIGSLITACCLVDRARVPSGEFFDEAFFIYFEDHDFGVRLRALGRDLLSVGRARCYHGAGTAGLSIRSLGHYSTRRVHYLIRNRWQFILKTYSLRTLALLAPLLAVYEGAQLVIVIRNGWLTPWARAIRWIVQHRAHILAGRRALQRRRIVPDRALLAPGPLPFRPELVAHGPARLAKGVLDLVTSGYWSAVKRLV